MRMPADHYGVKDGSRKNVLDVLRQQGKSGRYPLPRQVGYGLAIESSRPAIHGPEPGKGMQSQGFADAVRTQHGEHLTCVNLQVEIFNQCAAGNADRDTGAGQA
jgi:hypothetical protein